MVHQRAARSRGEPRARLDHGDEATQAVGGRRRDFVDGGNIGRVPAAVASARECGIAPAWEEIWIAIGGATLWAEEGR